MAMFKGFKPQGMQKIANRLGYSGDMVNFDNYLEQNPEKQRQMIVYEDAARKMAEGGYVSMQTGGLFGAGLGGIGNTRVLGASVGSLGAPSYVSPIMPPTDPNNPLGPVGTAVMRYGYNPTTNQYSISGGGGEQFPEGFESSMNYGDLYKKYPQIKGVFEGGRPQPNQKTLQDMMVGQPGLPMMVSPGFDPRYEGRNAQDYGQRNQIPVGTGGFGQEGFDIEKARQVTPDPRLLELERNFRGAATADMSTRLRPDGSLYVGSSSMFGDIYGQGGLYQQTYPSGLVDPRDNVAKPTPPAIAADTNEYMDYFVLPDGTGFEKDRRNRMAIPTGAKGVSYDEYLKLPKQQPLSGLKSVEDDRQQAYVPTTGTGQGQIPVFGTQTNPQNITDATALRAQTGALPVGAVTQPELTPFEQSQLINPNTGMGQANVISATGQAGLAQAGQTGAIPAAQMTPVVAQEAVQNALATNQAAQTDVSDKAQILAAQATASSVANLNAAQGNAILMASPSQRAIREGELVDSVTNAETAKTFTEQVQAATATASDQATVAGQLATLTTNFDATNPPAWASGAIRGVQAVMQQRGLGASSIAGQALVQAAMESALPIAQADANTVRTFELQNLSNRQQRAMLAAQQRASFIGQEFDQQFQARVQNAAKISDVANRNFTADQQIQLENSRIANTLNLQNLTNRQALVLAEASALTGLDTSNLTNRQQAAVENAKSFLQVDMANLSNEQQSGMFNMQQLTQSILTDQAALNASQQFNATSQNQVDQFFANLRSQVEQFNATQSNAQDQFNAGELNTLARFNAEVMNARDQFNAQNQIAIAQNNAVWRRELATADTAAINRANELNAKAVLDISNEAYDDLWAFYADTMEWAWKSAENEQDRINALGVANISKEAQAYTAEQTKKAAGSSAIGSMLGTLGAAVIRGPFS
jgi:hypothetical protein